MSCIHWQQHGGKIAAFLCPCIAWSSFLACLRNLLQPAKLKLSWFFTSQNEHFELDHLAALSSKMTTLFAKCHAQKLHAIMHFLLILVKAELEWIFFFVFGISSLSSTTGQSFYWKWQSFLPIKLLKTYLTWKHSSDRADFLHFGTSISSTSSTIL